MRWPRLLLLALAALAWAGAAGAHDRFYYLGYEIVQVVDGDTDAIVADIAVKGFVRDVDVSADRKFLYVSRSRHFIRKVDLATNKVVASIDLNSDGWERFLSGFAVDPDGKTAWGSLLSRTTRAV